MDQGDPLCFRQTKRRRLKDPVKHPGDTLPAQLLQTNTPQDLAYVVLTSDKDVYTRQECLFIIAKLQQMLAPMFEGECEYIT